MSSQRKNSAPWFNCLQQLSNSGQSAAIERRFGVICKIKYLVYADAHSHTDAHGRVDLHADSRGKTATVVIVFS